MSTLNQMPLALIGENQNEYIKSGLIKNGFNVICLPADNRLAKPVSSHADMLILLLDNTVFCNEIYYQNNKEIFDFIRSYGYEISPSSFLVSSEYPQDIALNQAVIGTSILGREDSVAKSIIDYASSRGYTYRNIKQGYAKCSTLVLNENAIISADKSVISAAKSLDVDTLQIYNGASEIELCGYDYGFIGGASAVYGNTVFFFGDITLHSPGSKIAEFCQKHGFSINSLGKQKLCDIGGAIILPYINAK